MSIVTKTGDKGTTGLMYGRRVMKCHPRVEAYGAVDELNAALGLARATADQDFTRELVLTLQKDLIVVMGELALSPEDTQRYLKDGYPVVTAEMVSRLEKQIQELEAGAVRVTDWVIPGASMHSSALDLARTVCRRAERCVSALQRDGHLPNVQVLVYLNRLADLLWLLARWTEAKGS